MDHKLRNLDDPVMESAVADYAVKLHTILRKNISKYGEESVHELFPFCIEILENLNNRIVDNEKLITTNSELVKKCEDLSASVEKLKLLRQKDLEKSLEIEDDLEQELFDNQDKITSLETKLKASLDDLSKKSEAIVYLNETVNSLGVQAENLLKDKIALQNEIALMRGQYYFPLQYSTISVPVAVAPFAVNVFEGFTSPENEKMRIENVQQLQQCGNMKRKGSLSNVNISLYSDYQGRDLSTLLKNQFYSKNAMIKPSLVKSGAPVREIVEAVKLDANRFTEDDFIVIIGGSSDIGFNSQAHIMEAYYDMLNCNLNCRFIISTIPSRYDLGPFSNENNLIRKINLKIKTLLNKYPNVKILDLGTKNRRFFTSDGKRFNTTGKIGIVKNIYKIIDKW